VWRWGGKGGGGPDRESALSLAGLEGEESTMLAAYPECLKCRVGRLIPLSDYGRDGAPITYKAWVCSNPECGYTLRIDNGEISVGRVVGQSAK
jgi:hypothetical protein